MAQAAVKAPDQWAQFPDAPPRPRVIEFEGRRIEVPADATDDDIRYILSQPPSQPAQAPAASATGGPVAMKKYTVTGPDGAKYEMTAPNDEAARAAVMQMFGGAPGANPFDKFDPPNPYAKYATPSVVDPNPYAKYAPPGAPAPAAKTAPSLVDTIMGVADQGARGVASGVINLATLPIELAGLMRQGGRWALGKAGVSDGTADTVTKVMNPLSLVQPYVGADALKGYLDKGNNAVADLLGVERPRQEGRNFTERMANRVGEEVGAVALPIGGAVAAGAKMGVDAARRLPTLARMFVEPAAIDAAKFVKKEGLTALAAGTGAGLVNEGTRAMGADKGTVTHAVGDIAGALAGAGVLGAGRMVAPAAGDIAGAVFGRPKQAGRIVQEAVTDRLIENTIGAPPKSGEAIDTQPIIDAINRGRRVSDTIPGYRDTLADRTQDPGLAALEYGRVSGPNSGAFVQRRAENTAAIDNSFAALEPQGSPAALREALTTERGQRLTDAAVARETAQSDLDATAQRLMPSSPYAEDRGAAVRAGVQNAEQAARETERAAWQGIGGDVDPAPLAGRFDQVTAGMPVARQQVVADLENALGIPAGFNGPVNVQEITALRSRLTTAQRNALRGPQPDANRASAIGQYLDELDAFMTRSGLPEDTLRRTELARGVSHDVNERFNRPNDPLATVLSTKEGRPDVSDAAVARRFVQPDSGQTSNLDRLLAETDLSSHARSTRQGIRDEVLADVQARGLIGRPDAIEEYLNSRTALFSRFPGLRDEIAQAGAASRRTLDATATESTLQRELGTADRAGTGTVGQYLRYGDERAEAAFDTVLRSKEPGRAADELLTFANNDPQAVEGARKAFWNVMQKRARSAGETTATVAGAQPWMPHALKRFLDDPATVAVADRLYRDNPEHLADIRKIAEALQGVDLRSRARAPNTSGTAQGVNNVLTLETIQSRFLSYKRGQIGAPFLITSLAAVAARRSVRKANADAINGLLDNALLNPDTAALLLKENNPANRAALSRSAKTFLGNEAATLADILDGDEQDPVKGAIMRGAK
ncbi:MAG: hypothetical protein K2Z80_37475 [Xanthobacteraceae bacterium]|nr:hypothetical protein [Xanthobacteraceae bacterium]